MAKRKSKADIFQRTRLQPAQLRTVADRRYKDALALRDTGNNERANGAMYLGGFAVECLLKARLLEEHPWLESARTAEGRSMEDRRLWSLFYRSHDLRELLERLPAIAKKPAAGPESEHLLDSLRSICGQWTIFARYSPQSADMNSARIFLADVERIKRWLR